MEVDYPDGSYTIWTWVDDAGAPVSRETATEVEGVDYDAGGKMTGRSTVSAERARQLGRLPFSDDRFYNDDGIRPA